tara:strand:- start:237 stop:494 length:258 start_codon:yes stop_codon:yes gene_type:complete
MEDLLTGVESLIGIILAIVVYLIARAGLKPLIDKLNNWVRHRDISQDESERALEAYPLSEKELQKIAFDERVKAEAAKEEAEKTE